MALLTIATIGCAMAPLIGWLATFRAL